VSASVLTNTRHQVRQHLVTETNAVELPISWRSTQGP